MKLSERIEELAGRETPPTKKELTSLAYEAMEIEAENLHMGVLCDAFRITMTRYEEKITAMRSIITEYQQKGQQ